MSQMHPARREYKIKQHNANQDFVDKLMRDQFIADLKLDAKNTFKFPALPCTCNIPLHLEGEGEQLQNGVNAACPFRITCFTCVKIF